MSSSNSDTPFAGYDNMDECVEDNQDQSDPVAFCQNLKKTGHENYKSEKLKMKESQSSSKLVGFKMVARLAAPAKEGDTFVLSGNNRKWSMDELKKASEKYVGKPVMLDHSMDTDKALGITTRSWFGPSEANMNDKITALRAESIGLVSPDMLEKLRTDGKNAIGRAIIKNVSIAGMGENKTDEEGFEWPTNFEPEEYSITPFPGIKTAEIESFTKYEAFRESMKDQLVKKKEHIVESKLEEKKMPEKDPRLDVIKQLEEAAAKAINTISNETPVRLETKVEEKKDPASTMKEELESLRKTKMDLEAKIAVYESQGKRVPANYGKGSTTVEENDKPSLLSGTFAVQERAVELDKQGYSRRDVKSMVLHELMEELKLRS